MSVFFGSVVFFFAWGDLLATCVTGSGLSLKLSGDFTDVSGDEVSLFLGGDGFTDFDFFDSVVCLVCCGDSDTSVVVEDGFSFKLSGVNVSCNFSGIRFNFCSGSVVCSVVWGG